MILLWFTRFRKRCKLVVHHFLCEWPFTVGIFFSPLSPFIILPLKSTFLWKLFTQHSRLFWFHYWTISKPFFFRRYLFSFCLQKNICTCTHFMWLRASVYAQSLSCVQLFCSLMDCSLPVSSLHGFIPASVQFSHSVMSDSLRPHELQHARPPCPSPTPGVYPNSCPSSQWCHPAISSSAVPFSSCPQSLPASRSFPISQLFAWCGQTIGVSASASVFQWTPRTDLF